MLGRRKPTTTGRRPTLSDRNNAPVFSYRANRSTNDTNIGRGQETPTAKKSRSTPWHSQLVVWLCLAVIGLAILYATLLTPNAKIVIKDSPAAREELRSTVVYQQAANSILSGVSNRSKLTLNPEDVASKLQSQFPELRQVSVTIPLLGKRPVITLEPVQPALVISGNGGNFVIDTDGKAIARTTDLPEASKSLRTVTDQSGLEIKAGQRILPQESVAFITTYAQHLQAKNVKITALILPPAPDELDVRVDGQPYVIKTNLLGDPRVQAGMYLAVRDKFKADNTTPSEVVDTRVEERVYYK